MKKKLFSAIKEQIQKRLVRGCDSLNDGTRNIIILLMGLILGGGSVILIFQSIYNFNKDTKNTNMPKIRHIERLELQNMDSLNTFNLQKYDTDREYPTTKSE